MELRIFWRQTTGVFPELSRKFRKKISWCNNPLLCLQSTFGSGTFAPMTSIYNCLKSLKLTSDANRYSQLRNMERVLKRFVVPPTPTNLPLPPLSLRRLRR